MGLLISPVTQSNNAVTLSGTTSSVTSAGDVLTPTTIVDNTLSGFSGNTFTPAATGFYWVSASLDGPNVAYSAGNSVAIGYAVNGGTAVYFGRQRASAATTTIYSPSGGALVKLTAGVDVLRFVGMSSVTGNCTGLTASIVLIFRA